jgi:hypothetical protein
VIRSVCKACYLALFVLSAPLVSVTHAQKPAPEVLNNKSIVGMVALKLPDELIIAKIESSPTEFDVSTAGLVELTKGKVSTTVIKAMMARPAAPPPAVSNPAARSASNAVSAQVPATTGSDEAFPTTPGIYIRMDSVGGTKGFFELNPAAYTQGKSGGFLNRVQTAATLGAVKTKTRAVIRGTTANTGTTDPNASFYFVFGNVPSAGPNSTTSLFGNGVTSPNEFTLLRMKVVDKSRETVVAAYNAWGSESGASDEAVVQYSFERVAPGVFKVSPRLPMQRGEYAFFSAAGFGLAASTAGGAALSRLWDFYVR